MPHLIAALRQLWGRFAEADGGACNVTYAVNVPAILDQESLGIET
ncbi:hypothetical protein QEH68_09780 [Paenarthrobacter sp. OM7]|nr:hypothetical protein [Paenarthrobacter sp. OM7]WGM22432.1 hypothetical protein QEH68_09780 [Paenarthrobacter sp. OM7]